jgi:hypothetical protein
MVIRLRELKKVRKVMHRCMTCINDPDPIHDPCVHHVACKCKCLVCTNPKSGGELYDFKNVIMCDKGDSRHYAITCVLGQCLNCGFEKAVNCCPLESSRCEKPVDVKVLAKVEMDTKEGVKNVMAEVSKTMRFKQFMIDTRKEIDSFLVHDFVARWQGDLYHRMLMGEGLDKLKHGTELWISDYIENFSTFSALELQQDYYHKTQVAIFIVLVIRHRDAGEHVLPSEVTPPLTSYQPFP